MRPEVLFTYFADIGGLPGVGPRIRMHFERLIGTRYVDLLWHLPVGIVDRSERPLVYQAPADKIVTLEVEIISHNAGPTKRSPYKVLCRDDSGFINLVFFKPRKEWLLSQLPIGETRIVSGKIEMYQGKAQMTHPDYILPMSKIDELPLFETIYPLTAGLNGKVIRKAVSAILDKISKLPEWHDPELIKNKNWPTFNEALANLHLPVNAGEESTSFKSRERLAFDELLSSQLAMALVREKIKKMHGRSYNGDGQLRDIILKHLPYKLTNDQTTVLAEVKSDMSSHHKMLRLIQGDVGSGKTIVALLSMLFAVEDGAQAALLAPTEILTQQHMATLKPLVEAAGLNIEILTGRVKGKARTQVLENLRTGKIDILVGTHAILQEDVEFKDLGIVVIDEQHRFGVHQRLSLSNKGHNADVLVMTATPIPRTLTLTIYGDMDVSRILEKPPGRQPIDTRVISAERLEEVTSGVKRAISNGARAYWICPLVEENEKIDAAAAEERFKYLSGIFGDRVGLVHGRMKPLEKDQVMEQFSSGEIDILVSTTVVEVGVDVPEATIMIIEQAERFGLSQLHQLRGRVGRGAEKSVCILIASPFIGEIARERLQIMRKSEDGFVIAEKDLELRGGGEALGTQQSGLPNMKLMDFMEHKHLFGLANKYARLITQKNPELNGDRGEALKTLLYLFERDSAIKLLKSG